MKTHFLKGSKQEIAEDLLRISGKVHEAIVFVEETASLEDGPQTHDSSDIFASMKPFMVDVDGLDDTREAIYSRLEGE